MSYLAFVVFALASAALLAFAGYVAYAWPAIKLRRNLRYVGFVSQPGGKVILRFENRNGDIEEYEGECTVWHSLTSGKRCAVQIEGFLFKTWEARVRSAQ
jgi:hypothetical protein